MAASTETLPSDEAALIEQCRAGDVSAFDEIVRRHKDCVYNVVYRWLGNHEDAQDIAQEVFVRAYRGMDGFEGRAKISTWLFRIAANLARNRLRDLGRKGRNRGVSLDALEEDAPGAAQTAAAETATPRDAAMHGELERALAACLGKLPEHYRMAFVLRVREGLAYDEICDSLECPLGTLKSRLNQARALLRGCLERQGVLEP